jgi:S1-C subfamily serine protease
VTQRIGIVFVLVVLTAAISASAQGHQAAFRDASKKWHNAVINVRVSLKVRMSMGGREVQSMDDTVDAVATVIDPSGLAVMSLSSLDPGAMMSRIMGAAAGGGDQKMSIVSEPTDVRMRLADGKELAATIALRDQDLDLAFIRPTAAPASPLTAVNLADSKSPAILDELIVLSRLSRVGGFVPASIPYTVSAIMEKPRTFFVLNGPAGTGTPAFGADGKVVGLLTIRQIDPGRMSMFGMMGGTEGAGVIAVVLPAADVLEIAKQVTEKK